ncbi:hypothetical protein ACUN24_24785 [Pedobacter sp. WC2501]|uniref:hypothetical protein n=1 Tax=Pedobacter sp. WC2501 TaxID=3461400 RepID=UPI0040454D97
MKNIRIEEIGDINFDYPYLEVFFKDNKNPFLEIGISEERQLLFKLYSSKVDVSLSFEDLEYIINTAKDFLPQALENEDDFLNF